MTDVTQVTKNLSNMKITKNIIIGFASFAVAAASAPAQTVVATKTLRTTAYFVGLTQGTNVSTNKVTGVVTTRPQYEYFDFAGHNLVNLAEGRGIKDTNVPSQVLAMTFACDLSSASLVVYDLKTSNVLTTIGQSSSIDSVDQQDLNVKGGPNRAHFIAVIPLNVNGNDTNGVAGGYFTVAGRINLNPETGCPQPVLVVLDRDQLDRLVDDVELPSKDDPDSVPLIFRTGLAHAIGVVDAVTDGGTNTVLVPYAGLSIRRELPTGPSVISTAAN
jgi:hypothetical protein